MIGKQPWAPRTHDLEFLGKQLQVPSDVAEDLALLNPAFGLVRYPELLRGLAPVDAVTPAIAAEHGAAAERIMVWLAQCLTPPPIQS